MAYPKAYEPEFGFMYQILVYDNYNREYEHCDYAKDKAEKNFLLNEYRMIYSNNKLKVILLPKKYHEKN